MSQKLKERFEEVLEKFGMAVSDHTENLLDGVAQNTSRIADNMSEWDILQAIRWSKTHRNSEKYGKDLRT